MRISRYAKIRCVSTGLIDNAHEHRDFLLYGALRVRVRVDKAGKKPSYHEILMIHVRVRAPIRVRAKAKDLLTQIQP